MRRHLFRKSSRASLFLIKSALVIDDMQTAETNPQADATRATAASLNRRACPVWLPAALLFVAIIFVFWPTTGHDFVNYDDPAYVTKNLHVQNGFTRNSVKWAFTGTVVGNWQPLTPLSHMLDYRLFGLKPWGHHLSNVLLHGANTVLVFLLLWRLTGANWRSFMVAASFGLHPLHVESVAWVAERKDTLSAFFGLICLIAYARYARGPTVQSPQSKLRNHAWGYYWAALVLFALGLMSKPMLVTLPFVMLLLDYWPLNRVRYFEKLLPEKIPFFLLAAAMSVVTYLVQRQTGMMDSLENVPLSGRMENALISYFRYIGKLFWPTRLAVFYPYPEHDWLIGWVLLAALGMACISALVYTLRGRRPWLLVGWLWFCGTLLPVIGLVQVGGQAMADRYTYLPSIGLLILVVWGLAEAGQPWRHHGVILWVAGCVLIIACSGLTREQLRYWQDSETLYQHALAVTENNYLAHHNLGIYFFSKGRTDEAITQYQEALQVQPDSAMAHYDLGAALGKKGETDEAIIQFQKALKLNPDNADARINLGTAIAMKGRTDEAIAEFAEALRRKPDNAEAHYDLGALYGREGKLDEAIAEFQEAIRLQPDYAAARLNLVHAMELKNNR